MTEPAGVSSLFDRMVARAAEPSPLALTLREPESAAREPSGELVEEQIVEPLRRTVPQRDVAAPVRPAAPAFDRVFGDPPVQPARERIETPALTAQPREAAIREVTVHVPAPPAAALSRPTRAPAAPAPAAAQRPRTVEVNIRPLRGQAAAPAHLTPDRMDTAPARPQAIFVQPDLPAPIPERASIRHEAQQTSTPTETVIHVTIGRLEVRPPERSKKQQSAASEPAATRRPTLEEFLAKRRSSGGPA